MATLTKVQMRAIAAIALVADVAAAQHQPGGADQVDQLVFQEMAARKIPGVSVAVIENGKTVKKASYGLASVERTRGGPLRGRDTGTCCLGPGGAHVQMAIAVNSRLSGRIGAGVVTELCPSVACTRWIGSPRSKAWEALAKFRQF